MKELDLKDEEELQGWFVLQAVDFLKKHGKTAIVWNESLNSGMMPKDIIVQRWMDKKDRSVEFANNGGKVIVSEFYYYYCDYPYGMTSLKKTYSLDPYIKGLTEAGKKNVYGARFGRSMSATLTGSRICASRASGLLPRLAGQREKIWTAKALRSALKLCAQCSKISA